MTDCIEYINEIALKYPDRIAVLDGDKQISYAEFQLLVGKISQNLVLIGSCPKVVIDLQQGINAYALIFAILNVGGTYCPLSLDAPLERKLQIINEFNPDIVIVENDNELFTTSFNIGLFESLVTADLQSGKVFYDPESTAYVIYTSGSTGMPKGVMIARKSLNKFLEWSIPAYSAGEKDIWGQFSALSFDLSIVDIFTCLCSGATLLAMNDIPAKKNRPAATIEKHHITIWHSVPSAVEFMMVNEKRKSYDLDSLRLMSFCGEPLRKHQVSFLFEKNPNIKIFNTYGPTEGTLFCTWQEFTSENYLNYCDFTMSIGRPIPGWNFFLSPTVIEKEKEIIIYGEYIGKGYLKGSDATKFKTLIVDGESVICFESGDIVTEKENNLYFSSRKDRQVQIKGYRVELDEVDFRINEFLQKISVTVVKKDTLYSFIESEEGINEDEIREFLKQKLEPYKIPNVFYILNKIPRGQNQKVEVNSLIALIP